MVYIGQIMSCYYELTTINYFSKPNLVHGYEGGRPEVGLLEELHALDPSVHGVYHAVVQGSTSSANGHVVLVRDGTEIALLKPKPVKI